MLSDMYTLQQILVSFENTLRIDYREADTQAVIKGAVQGLENAYQCKLDQPVYTVQAQNMLVADTLNEFLATLSKCFGDLAALSTISMFTKKTPIRLEDVNYLGSTSASLMTALKYLQDRVLYEQRGDIVTRLPSMLNNVEMCQVKRLFIIMLVLERLGIFEGVAACAQLLYLGGLAL